MSLHPKIQALLEERAREAAEEAARARQDARKRGEKLLALATGQAPVLAELLESGALRYDPEGWVLSGEGLAPIMLERAEVGRGVVFRPATRARYPSEHDWGEWHFSYFDDTQDFAKALELAYAAAETQDDAEPPEPTLYCPFMDGRACMEGDCALWVNDGDGEGYCALLAIADIADALRHSLKE